MGEVLQSPLVILCGKGGVGKTTLGMALGLWHARAGRKVLLVTSHPLPELAVTISLSGLKESHPAAAANLFIVHIDPQEILANKVRQQIPSEFLARTVLTSRIYQNLVEVAPGLKELAFLARLHQLAERKSPDAESHAYDVLIWDAPATGHFLQTLKVSRNFDTYLSGPFAVLGRELTHFLSDPARIRLIPVTILEEMVVEETIELCAGLKKELGMSPAGLICNLASPLLASGEECDLGQFAAFRAGGSSGADWQFLIDRHEIEKHLYRKLLAEVTAKPYVIGRVPHWNSELELLDTLAISMGACPAGVL